MRLYSFSFLLTTVSLLCASLLRAQDNRIVQINGVIMTADSLRAVANATVVVKHQNRGVISSERGVFSIVCYKGDTLQFTALGFRDKQYVVPHDIQGEYFSMIQLMVQDTFYLPETIVRPVPSKAEFDYAFRNWRIPDDQYELARKNTNAYTLRVLGYTLPKDGGENQSSYQNIQANRAVYYGQMPPSNLFSPIAWGQFFEAWKRGDFRRKY